MRHVKLNVGFPVVVSLLALLAMVFLSACIQTPASQDVQDQDVQDHGAAASGEINYTKQNRKLGEQVVNFVTTDGVAIFGTLYSNSDTNRSVVLVHMLSSDRKAYEDFARQLQQQGFNALSIDMRGHGQSTMQIRSWQIMGPPDFQNSVRDIEAAVQYLENQGMQPDALVGASIGANLALIYGAISQGTKKIVLLSPGIDYRGVNIGPVAPEYKSAAFLIAAFDDEYSASTVQTIDNAMKNQDNKIRIFESGGHGTNLLTTQPGVKQEIIDWLKT
ncbi:MAG: alpha/beta fold hydrolase [DPANN group archaeon]|nr:alpha/beta fold hydrolase [DPANN group archaeon]